MASVDSSDAGVARQPNELASSKAQATKAVKKETKVLTDTKMFYSLDKVDSPLLVDPGELVFENAVPGTVFVMTFSIRNMTKTGQRIRLSPPKTNVFALNYIPASSVAPGLDVRAEVQCCLPEGSKHFIFTDTIVASMGPHRVEVPLMGRKPAPNFSFSPTLEFGLVAEGQTSTSTLYVENLGSVAGQISLDLDSSSQLSVSPKSLTLVPKGQKGTSKSCFHVKFVGNECGAYRELVNVIATGNEDPMLLDVSANVVVQKMTLLSKSKGVIVDNIDFGMLVFGQTKVVESHLVNNSPLPVTYVIKDADEAVRAVADEETSEDPTAQHEENPITIRPLEGTIEAYGQVTITATYSPIIPKPTRGFMGAILKDLSEPTTSSLKVSIYSQESDQTVDVSLQGTSALPKFTVSPLITRFGVCPVLDRRDATLTLNNASPVPMSFDFSKVAHFKVNPSKGTLQPQQVLSVIASFTPAQLGKFKGTMHCKVSNGIRDIEVRFTGESEPSTIKKELIGGTTALPEHFKPNLKFIDPEVVKKAKGGTGFKRMEPWETIDFQQTASSSLLVYDQSASMLGGVNPKVEALQKKNANRQLYNTFLKDATTKRQEVKRRKLHESMRARGINLRSDPDGVDLGMEKGLDEPEIEIHGGYEPLWTADKNGDDSKGGAGNGKGFHSDENRLIQRKFHDSPVTQADAKDCAAELTLEKLKSVVASHKVINFGRVNVSSVTAKNFSVSNQLLSMILVKLGTLEQELKQSRPTAQAIPPGAVAGFDLIFSCREVCKYKKTFSWVINDHHVNKVTVLAEVIPIELMMDRKQVSLEFPSSSVEPSISEQITLSNPGNAIAEFVWGNEGAFECLPERGTIGPGESVSVAVVWTPNAAHRNEANIGLRVAGGIDSSLAVSGMFVDAKAAFDSRKMDFGTIAVGTEKKKSTHLRNTGTAPLVFWFDDLPELAYMSISPKRGLIMPGETADISVFAFPRSATIYDNKTIVAYVRGGKPAIIKLSGTAIVPQVYLEQSQIDFGGVVVGSDMRMPITIRNTGAIRVSVIFDLTSYRDFSPSLDADDFTISPSVGHTEFSNAQPVNVILDPMTKSELSAALYAGGNVVTQATPNRGTPKLGQTVFENEPIGAWRLTLAPDAIFEGVLQFAPSRQKTYSFKLPVYLQGRLHDNDFNCEIKADGLASRLKVSAFSVDFGDKIVNRDSSIVVSYFQEVVFTNVDKVNGLSYEIREAPLASVAHLTRLDSVETDIGLSEVRPVYFISPTSGGLSPGESSTVRLTFMPPSNGEFQKKLHIYVEGQADPTRPYFILHCRGFGVYPRLSFSKDSIVLPTVPLSVTTRTSVTVFNSGYDGLELKYRVSPSVPIPLDITFPDGNELGLIISKVKVVISTSYESAVSWTGKIEFYDDDGEHFFIDISGCGDGSLLSNYPFVKDYSDKFGFLALDNKPVSFYSKKDLVAVRARENKIKAALRAHSQAVKDNTDGKIPAPPVDPPLQLSDDGIDIDRENVKAVKKDSIDDRDVKFLIKWLNGYIVRRQINVNDYLTNIIETDGDIIVDAIEQMSGKKIPNLKQSDPSGKPRNGTGATSKQQSRQNSSTDDNPANANEDSEITSKRARVKATLYKYKSMIEFVVKHGGLLIHISPKSLLNVDDYVFAQEDDLWAREGERLTTSYAKERKVMWQKDWLENCHKGWSELLFQTFKTFVLYRTSFVEYCHTPGIVPPIMAPDDSPVPPKGTVAAAPKGKTGKGKEGEGATKKNKGPKIPPEFQPSNVYSSAEALIMAWTAFHLQKGARLSAENQVGGGTQFQTAVIRRVTDFDAELSDLYGLLHIIYSHLPDLAKEKGPLASYSAADTEHSKEAHFKRLKQALKAMQLDFDVDADELTGSSRCFLILLMHLFLNLPSFLPKATVEFKGCLGSGKPIIKAIELRNPSQKRVTYRVSIDGSSDFSVPDTQISLDPMSAMDVLVHCNPRFTTPAKAVLTFRGIRDSGFSGTTMVFNLISAINEIRPLEVHHRNVALYEMDITKVIVTNPFDTDCLFPISLVQKSTPTTIRNLLGQGGGVKAGSGAPRSVGNVMASLMLKNNSVSSHGSAADKEKKEDTGAEDANHIFHEPFWVVEQNLHLPARSSGTITLFALPFQLGSFSCQIIMSDPHVGQFAHEVVMSVGLPQALDKLSLSIPKPEIGCSAQYLLRVCSSNVSFDRAVLQATEARLSSNKRTRARHYLQSMVASPRAEEGSGYCTFNVDISSPFFTARKDIQLSTGYTVLHSPPPPTAPGAPTSSPDRKPAVTPASGKRPTCMKSALEALKPGDVRPSGAELDNAMLLAFTPEKSGTYKSRFLFYGHDNGADIRILEITANVTPSDSAMLIEFNGPARQEMLQDIPLVNESADTWHLAATVTGRGFSVPSSVDVGPGEKMDLQVTFCAPTSGKMEGVLTLRNTANNDAYTYKLCGVAEEPLAENTLQFKCNARTRSHFSIPLMFIKGIGKPEDTFQRFEVETDLEYVSGPSEVRVFQERPGEYAFSVMSPVSGRMAGSITFKEPKSGEIVWYLVEIEVTSPLAERVIDLECPVRKVVGADISLENPTKEPLHFTVHLEGDGLLGESHYTLNPNSSNDSSPAYELIYSPLVTGQSVGAIRFKNDIVGEFWYKCNLFATPAEVTKLDLMECMIGQSLTIQVPIENPLADMVNMTTRLSDTRHFSLATEVITLGPYSQNVFELSFHPSSMNDIVTGEVILSNPILGEVVFEVSGKGLMPGVMPPVNIIAPMNQMSSKTLSFHNPFSFPLPLDIVLTSQGDAPGARLGSPQTHSPREIGTSAFSLLLRKPTGLVIAPDSTLQLGIAFCPEKLGKYSAAVELRATLPGRSLLWCYPIFGMAAAGEPIILPKMSTPVKSSLIKDVHIPLSGLMREDVMANGHPDLCENDFVIEHIVSPELRTQLKRSFKVQLLEVVSMADNPSNDSTKKGNYALRFRLLFEPLKLLHTEVEIGIVCKDRGRWRADVELEAIDPPPDDTIRLVAKVGDVDKVAFTISNRFLGQSPFQAFFGAHSSSHFTVSPASGIMAPYGSEGTQFVVSFRPKEYGGRERGMLTIQTDESQWNYEVIGSYPDVSIDNSIVKSKLNLGLPPRK